MFAAIHPDVQAKILQGFWFVYSKTMRRQIRSPHPRLTLSLESSHSRLDDGGKLKHLNQNDSEACEDFISEAPCVGDSAETLLIEIIKCS